MNKPKYESGDRVKYDVGYLFASLVAEIVTEDLTLIEHRDDKDLWLNLADDLRRVHRKRLEGKTDD